MFLFIKHQALYKLYVKLKIVCWKLLLLKTKNSNIPKTFIQQTHKKKNRSLGNAKNKKDVKEKLNFFKMKLKKFRESSLYEVFYYFSLLYSHHQPTNQQHHRKIPHSKSHIQIKIHSKQTNDERNQQQQQIIIYSFFLTNFLLCLFLSFFLLLSWLNNNKNATRKKESDVDEVKKDEEMKKNNFSRTF